jgi:hypothetical protein
MKKTLTVILAGAVLSGFIPPPGSCDSLLYFKEGATTTMTSYNDDGKPTGSSKTVYGKVNKSGDAVSVSATQEVYDKKGKLQGNTQFTVSCAGGNINVDMRSMIPNPDSYKDMEMTVEGGNLEWPANLSVGTSLKDATMKLVVKSKEGMPMPMMNMEMKITNRKVEAKENVTTPAGTFECYKITENVESKTIFAVKMKSISWFSPELGTVKTESYKENGKFAGKTELTQFTKK